MARAWPLLTFVAALLAPVGARAQAEPPVVVSSSIANTAVSGAPSDRANIAIRSATDIASSWSCVT